MALTPVETTKAFRRDYRKKTPSMQEIIRRATVQLRKDWRHPGLRTHRVRSTKGVYEARLDGGNRLTFHWEGDTIWLRKNCNHDILKVP